MAEVGQVAQPLHVVRLAQLLGDREKEVSERLVAGGARIPSHDERRKRKKYLQLAEFYAWGGVPYPVFPILCACAKLVIRALERAWTDATRGVIRYGEGQRISASPLRETPISIS